MKFLSLFETMLLGTLSTIILNLLAINQSAVLFLGLFCWMMLGNILIYNLFYRGYFSESSGKFWTFIRPILPPPVVRNTTAAQLLNTAITCGFGIAFSMQGLL